MRQPLDQRGARERPSWHGLPATDLADALAHGLIALDVDYIRAINDAINNRIGYCALAELGMPAGWRELRADQLGAGAQPALDDLEELSRALAISERVTLHMKEDMGRLSPLCGSGIAGGTGSCCGMTYLQGGTLQEIKYAINNMIAMLQGMICDGAKATCALKIAAGTNAAIQCSTLALSDIAPSSLDGIVFDDAEDTIRSIGTFVREGMRHTDETILGIMLEKQLKK